jgi:hypothetical protein
MTDTAHLLASRPARRGHRTAAEPQPAPPPKLPCIEAAFPRLFSFYWRVSLITSAIGKGLSARFGGRFHVLEDR